MNSKILSNKNKRELNESQGIFMEIIIMLNKMMNHDDRNDKKVENLAKNYFKVYSAWEKHNKYLQIQKVIQKKNSKNLRIYHLQSKR